MTTNKQLYLDAESNAAWTKLKELGYNPQALIRTFLKEHEGVKTHD